MPSEIPLLLPLSLESRMSESAVSRVVATPSITMLSAIIAVGYAVNFEHAVQLLKRASSILEQFTVMDYVMDDERVEACGSVRSDQYFEEQL